MECIRTRAWLVNMLPFCQCSEHSESSRNRLFCDWLEYIIHQSNPIGVIYDWNKHSGSIRCFVHTTCNTLQPPAGTGKRVQEWDGGEGGWNGAAMRAGTRMMLGLTASVSAESGPWRLGPVTLRRLWEAKTPPPHGIQRVPHWCHCIFMQGLTVEVGCNFHTVLESKWPSCIAFAWVCLVGRERESAAVALHQALHFRLTALLLVDNFYTVPVRDKPGRWIYQLWFHFSWVVNAIGGELFKFLWIQPISL